MPRFFNIAGPCIPGEHYLVPTLARLPQLDGLIAAKQFFVIHAARQSGKTTLLNALEQELNARQEVVALYCSLEGVQGIADAERGIPAVMRAILSNCEIHPLLNTVPLTSADMSDFTNGVKRLLFNLATAPGKPPASPRQAPGKPPASPRQAPGKPPASHWWCCSTRRTACRARR